MTMSLTVTRGLRGVALVNRSLRSITMMMMMMMMTKKKKTRQRVTSGKTAVSLSVYLDLSLLLSLSLPLIFLLENMEEREEEREGENHREDHHRLLCIYAAGRFSKLPLMPWQLWHRSGPLRHPLRVSMMRFQCD